MPIIDLQKRMRQLGEIRLGHVVDVAGRTNRRGEQMTRPEKLDKFRLTSPSRLLLERVAELYGGDVQEWTPPNGGPTEFEVYTKADRVPVIIPPQAITQWYELFQGSKCVRRCDGQLEQKSDRECMCDPESRECKPTTRLNVMLRDVEAIGVWLLTTHGYYAAVELPAYAELLAKSGGYVEGWLSIEERRVVRSDGEIARFMVPVLEVAVSPAQLLAGDGAARRAVGSGERKALEASAPRDWPAEIQACQSADALTELLQEAQRSGVAQNLGDQTDTVAAAFVQRRGQLAQVQAVAERVTQPTDDVDNLWAQIVSASPFDTLAELEQDFAKTADGVLPESATTLQMKTYLHRVKNRSAPAKPAAQERSEIPF